jgi:hypothetical protein
MLPDEQIPKHQLHGGVERWQIREMQLAAKTTEIHLYARTLAAGSCVDARNWWRRGSTEAAQDNNLKVTR